jgi:hypothetical protein
MLAKVDMCGDTAQTLLVKNWVRHGSFRPMVDIQSSSGFTVPPHLHEEISGSLGLGTTLAV